MRIGIVGSRRRNDKEDFFKLYKVFKEVYSNGDIIISGGCPKGGDRFAKIIAQKKSIEIKIYYPDWKRYGKGAGHIRNTDIAKNSDIILAVVSKDRKGGTEDTIKKAQKFGKEIRLII